MTDFPQWLMVVPPETIEGAREHIEKFLTRMLALEEQGDVSRRGFHREVVKTAQAVRLAVDTGQMSVDYLTVFAAVAVVLYRDARECGVGK